MTTGEPAAIPAGRPGGTEQNRTELNRKEGKDTSAATQKPVTSAALFSVFYDQYPRHEARTNAEKAWKKLSQAERIECLDKTPAWVKAKVGTERRYLPLPATYLNAGRWRDPIENPREKVQVVPGGSQPDPVREQWARAAKGPAEDSK